ncbi:helix-turn-helix domain-containing protein [Atribacter laminatus]|uniref:HTH cro/C1-type domain-containing protein n=1 Tax=Atribacter laminatus TaxID=2847778 RepID=A0A7T1ANA6_ATRLM|nr:helix-turn-helix transcriptional regulator [Atribacter laminatus]QPM69064.1 hypothetical protein RT761_02292 [Atribacter laminatus]
MVEKTLKEFFNNLKNNKEIESKIEYYKALSRLVLEVEEERLFKNISQEELANRMGTKQEAISRFESLKHKPGYDFLARLSKALGGRLSITTNGDYAFVVPNKYRHIIDKCAMEKGILTDDLIEDLFTQKLEEMQYSTIKHEKKQINIYEKTTKKYIIMEDDKEEYTGNLQLLDKNLEYAA